MSSRILIEEMGGVQGLLNALKSDSKVSELQILCGVKCAEYW